MPVNEPKPAEGKDLSLDLSDGAAVSDAKIERSPFTPERRPYRVTAENGLFKRGKRYDHGDFVDLDEKTAAAFIEAGEVEEVSDEN